MSKAKAKLANKPVEFAIFTINQSCDEIVDTRHKIALIQELFAPEREEIYLDWDSLAGLGILLTQIFDDLLSLNSNLSDATLALNKVVK